MALSASYKTSCSSLWTSVLFCLTDTASTEIYTLSLHDALPIWGVRAARGGLVRAAERDRRREGEQRERGPARRGDRKSTRLNSSHLGISYAVFCLKKKNDNKNEPEHEE